MRTYRVIGEAQESDPDESKAESVRPTEGLAKGRDCQHECDGGRDVLKHAYGDERKTFGGCVEEQQGTGRDQTGGRKVDLVLE